MSATDIGEDAFGAPGRVAPPRRRRGFWTDARFFIGLALVVASVAGVWAVVAAARQTVPVYAAAHVLVPGQPITADDLRIVEVALGGAADAYLAPGSAPASAVAARTVEAGELVPVSAAVSAAESDVTTVVVRTGADVPRAVRAGSVVEVWAAAQTERGVYAAPQVLLAHAVVASVTADDSMIGGGQSALELVIDRGDVADTLAAISAAAALSVVPARGAG